MQYTPIYFDDFETAPGTALSPGLVLSTGGSVTTDPALVISGKESIRLTNNAILSTNPAVLQLPPLTTYIIEFQYHLLSYGTADNPVDVWFSSTAKGSLKIGAPSLLKNASASGIFSSGAQTWGAASATSYVLNISVNGGADIVIDNVTLLRQDAVQTSAAPGSKLDDLPYPRLGINFPGGIYSNIRYGGPAAAGIPVEKVESRVAFFDLIAGLQPNTQTNEPDSIRRLRQLNPNAVFLPSRDFQLQAKTTVSSATSAPGDVFQRGVADVWYLRDSKGNYVSQVGYPDLYDMNISPFCPVVNGESYLSYWLRWLNQSIFPSGVWDGLYTSTMLAAVDPLIPNTSDPALFDVDYTGTGTRNTMAWVSEMAKSAAIGTLQQLRSTIGGSQLVLADGDNVPHPSLAPYLNGIQFECMNRAWNDGSSPVYYQERWRKEFDAYQQIEATERHPRINLVEGCTPIASMSPFSNYTLTPADYQNHRLTMGTALLGDGFYYFTNDEVGLPWWLDEYSVDSAGNAVEDRTKKGYLGQALSIATELTSPGKLELEQTFEGPSLPSSMGICCGTPGAAVYLTDKPGEVIQGTQSLVIDNPDHTKSGGIVANYGLNIQTGSDPWLLTFDWRILETLDGTTLFGNFGAGLFGPWQGFYPVPEIVKGASGTAHIPIAPSSQTASLPLVNFGVARGGGKVAIDNIRLYRGGVGPWRRDFENGFVLVNPLQYSHTFSAAELAGALNRTGIHRIKGTQAPDINNGQAVTGALTLGPFDAIILLADPILLQGTQKFQLADRGGVSKTSSGSSSALQVGYARIISYQGTTPSGMAIFDFRQNEILISEAAVPASPLTQSGRTYAEIGGPVDTGIAIANPNDQNATISFYYTDAKGANILAGTTTVSANGQISAFLDQAPFIKQVTDLSPVRSFTFASSVPVGVTVLRGYTNERGEFLITTLPVTALDTPPTSTAPFAFPHYADGGGWTSALVLLNPTDAAITGTAQFYSKGTPDNPGAPVVLTANGSSASGFSYTIPPRSSFKLQTGGTSSTIQTGWVSITPTSGSIAPSGLVVFSFNSNGVRVSEAGVQALPSSSAFRMYVENSASIQTGIALSNPTASNVIVNFDLTNLDGTATGITGSTFIPAMGQVALFLNQIHGFNGLPASFKGVLRISGATVFATGLRGRYNERGDFLITTTSPVDETVPPSAAELVFPQLADGGGYTTQIILFSGAPGQSASGILQFVSQSGQPLNLIIN